MKNFNLKRFLVLSFLFHLLLLFLFLQQKYRTPDKTTMYFISENEIPKKSVPLQKQAQKQLPPITANPPITSMLTQMQGPNPAYTLHDSGAAGLALPSPDTSSQDTKKADTQAEQPDASKDEAKPTPQKLQKTVDTQSLETAQSQAKPKLTKSDLTQKEASKTNISENKNMSGIKELTTNEQAPDEEAPEVDLPVKQTPKHKTASHSPNVKVSFPTLTGKKLLSMTSGYLKSLKAQGNSLMSRPGENKAPSLEELKYLSYQQQIDEMLMNSWRIVTTRNPQRRNVSLSSPASISFEVNQDGSLAYLQLVNSSGDAEFDRLALLSIKHAAPFPPIPKHLGITRYRPVGGQYRVQW